MDISYAYVKAIFDTLPIGYYLGRKIDTTLSKKSLDSYYKPMADTITISAPCILAACNNSNYINDLNVEELIRGLLYHEISHVILTGKNFINVFNHRFGEKSSKRTKYQTVFNIVEDERIETLLKDYYMNTNFRKNIFIINNFKGQPPMTKDEEFYQLVRFHIGDQKWIDKLGNLITQYKDLNAESSEWSFDRYIADLIRFYDDFCLTSSLPDAPVNEEPQYWSGSTGGSGSSSSSSISSSSQSFDSNEDNDSEDQNNGSGSSDSEDDEDTNDNGNGGSDDNSDGSEDQDKDGAGAGSEEEDAEEKARKEAEAINKDFEDRANKVKEFDTGKMISSKPGSQSSILKKNLNNIFEKFSNNALQGKLTKIITESEKKRGQFSGAFNSYSGRMDPRAVGDRDDYKWWVKKNRDANLKRYSKTHFNLFIDHSGSFERCNKAINELLWALNSIKSPDFDFDVITIDTEIVEWETSDQYEFYANGGTNLTNEIAPVIRRHQRPGCNNFNIVVFDGAAHGYGRYTTMNEPFNHFDTRNTILVVDKENSDFVRHLRNCKKEIIDKNYEITFIDTVLGLLERTI